MINRSCKTEVTDFDHVVFAQQDVSRGKVSVDYKPVGEVFHTACDLGRPRYKVRCRYERLVRIVVLDHGMIDVTERFLEVTSGLCDVVAIVAYVSGIGRVTTNS